MTDGNRPLVQKLMEFRKMESFSLHVPGHKGGLLSKLPTDLQLALSYDLTELEGLDDLHEPTGVIKKAEEKLATLYKSNRSFFLVNGSTVGNLAMVYAVCNVGDTIIVQRNAHKSIFNALELTNARPVFIAPKWNEETKAAGMVHKNQLIEALDTYPEAKAVILTYPNYYGDTGESLEEIIQLCHNHQIPVLVDEAHGAHFVIGKPFPQSALQMGADIVVHSAHKTLPAMTMASFLHIQSTLVSEKRVERYLNMLQSSSPSYLLMASLDDARAYAEEYTTADKSIFMQRRAFLIEQLKEIPRIQVVETADPLKLIVRLEGIPGFDLQKALNALGIYVELADPIQVLFVLPLGKKEHHFSYDVIIKQLKILSEKMNSQEVEDFPTAISMSELSISKLTYTVSELEQLPTGWLFYKHTIGKIAAASIIPYPPGIPLLLAGEMITTYHIQSLEALLKTGASFQGTICTREKKIWVVMNEQEE